MLAAPLWEPVQCRFVGIFTVTDFIDILRHYHQATGKDVSDLATHSIAEICFPNRNVNDSGDGASGGTNLALASSDEDAESKEGSTAGGTGGVGAQKSDLFPVRPFRGADSSCTLKQACRHLLQTGDDFLPIVFAEDMRVLACLSYTNMLEHLVTHFREQRRLFDDSIADLGIGTWAAGTAAASVVNTSDTSAASTRELITVHHNQTLAQALELMQQHSLSALPVLDENGRIYGVYSRSDITFLTKATDAEDAVRNLDLKLIDVLSQQRAGGSGAQQQPQQQQPGHPPLQPTQDVTTTPDALRTCSPSHTLQAIFESFSQVRFNRLYVVDNDDRLLGVVSAKDLVAYFLVDDDGNSDDASGDLMGG